MNNPRADIGVVGLAVMGRNLVLNMCDRGYAVAVHDRDAQVMDRFLASTAPSTRVIGAHSMHSLVTQLKRPRRILLMIRAGHPVDACIKTLLQVLEPSDIIIDGGNSYYKDTTRRVALVESKGLLYVGTGVSGGEEGARHGPSIMPGGSAAAWPHVRELLQGIAARADEYTPCCDWIGPYGAGHFVKMVHNGIEYGAMQIIAEAYAVMRMLLRMDNTAMSRAFGRWNEGPLHSYLIEITRDILAYRNADGSHEIDAILDSAGQKGTGKWTAMAALEYGIPLTTIGEAVHARFLSALKEERMQAEGALAKGAVRWSGSREQLLDALEGTVFGAMLLSYVQGFMLLAAASRANDWNLDLGRIALLWRSGCIIRSSFLEHIKAAFDQDLPHRNLLFAPYFRNALGSVIKDFRSVVAVGARHAIPIPAIASALAYYDGFRCGSGSANMIQAQRDFFGAHTYERVDTPRGVFHHTRWGGTGANTPAGSYDA